MKKKQKKDGSRFYRICYAIFAGIVGVIFRIKVIGAENEPDEGGFLVCANHVSACDPVVVCYAFRKHQISFMAKKELFKIPLLSLLIRTLGAFPVDRGGNDVGAVRFAVNLLRSKKCAGLFPQGHRYPAKDPRSTPRKNGAALICTRAEADIVPVYIWRKNNRLRIFSRTYVIIGNKIPFESLSFDPDKNGEYTRITDTVFDEVCRLGEEFTEGLEERGKK